MTTRSKVVITLAVGFALITAALVALLVQAPDQIISTNSVAVAEELGVFSPRTTVCQANERLPASTTALRMSLIAYIGPAVSVTVSQGAHRIATGHHGGGWISGSLTLPLKPAVATTATDATICLTRDRGATLAGFFGNVAPKALAATSNGAPLPGRIRTEYLTRGRQSWLSMARHVARRLGLGHSPSGTWIVLPLVVMMAAAIALGAWLLTRERSYE